MIEIKIEIAREGLKITHPSGLVCLETKADLQKQLEEDQRMVGLINLDIAQLTKSLNDIDKTVEIKPTRV